MTEGVDPGAPAVAPADGPGWGYASRRCLVCGRENRSGLRAVFETGPEGVVARAVVPPHLQGFDGLAHGGLVAGFLDDAMWYACYQAGAITLTGELTARFRRPVPVGRAVEARARLLGTRGRLFQAAAELRDGVTGELLAEARGKFLAVEEPLRSELAAAGIERVPAVILGGDAEASPGRGPAGGHGGKDGCLDALADQAR